jgi:hypothetical protein
MPVPRIDELDAGAAFTTQCRQRPLAIRINVVKGGENPIRPLQPVDFS